MRPEVARFAKRAVVAGFLLALASVLAVVMLIGFRAPGMEQDVRRRETVMVARKLASGAAMFIREHAACPTVRDLVNVGILSPKVDARDAWDREYNIDCAGAVVTVWSPGPDGTFATVDDLRAALEVPAPPGGR